MNSKLNNKVRIIKKLEENPIRNINMINFISNYGITFLYEFDNAIMISGISDKLWIYINAETKSDFDKLADKLSQFEYFAVVNDEQLKWFEGIVDYEIIMSCAKFFMPFGEVCCSIISIA